MKASDLDTTLKVIRTGFVGIDSALGGGLPLGKAVEAAGSWSVGKSTFAYQCIAAAQKQGFPCLLIDAERAYTQEYGMALGIDNLTLEIHRAPNAEEYLDFIAQWIEGDKDKGKKAHKKSLVVIDAIGQLLPREEQEKTADSRVIGLQARLLGSFSRKMVSILDDNEVCLLALNHTFIPLGQMGIASSGGKKWEYFRSIWMVFSRKYGAQVKKDSTGKKTVIPMEVQIKKNKIVANEGTKIDLDLVSGAGFVGETVEAPPKKKPGRPKSLPTNPVE